MRCPGQDMRYWKGDVVIDVPCPRCNAAVEFFKDETSGRCPKCGHRFRNPTVSFDCAKWCAFAQECVGAAPQDDATSRAGEGAIASGLIRAVKDEFGGDPPRIEFILRVFQFAKELLCRVGGDPRIILGAALLLRVDDQRANDSRCATSGNAADMTDAAGSEPKAREILRGLGLEEAVIDCVCHAIDNCRTGKDLQTIEHRIVCDAHALAKLAVEDLSRYGDRWEEVVDERLKTESGKQRARAMFAARKDASGGGVA